ncbi:MAG: N-acetyl-gamma-glutamyl-phosphate reductase [Clostridia bacterium]|nr:N-acetyl-gamma-glutamyl-phosphate reductase [Clostridia bacterium]
MKKKVFIDGSAGTTGIRIYERLGAREDLELLRLPEEKRKDPASRKEMLNAADIVFLCLPDDASREAVGMIENGHTVVIDTSTAHRTLEGWAYGFPELSKAFEEKILHSKRIAVPGCHASGFIALVKPLIDSGMLSKNAKLTCHSVTGYSGGGKKMIADYQSEERSQLLDGPRQYALTQNHKHLKEMKAICGLEHEPIFCPIVGDFYSGMTVTVPLFATDLNEGFTAEDIKKLYEEKYQTPIVFCAGADEDAMVSAVGLADKDSMGICVFGNEERILLVARYDNLGKGASGAAVEVMNLIMGVDRKTGLNV